MIDIIFDDFLSLVISLIFAIGAVRVYMLLRRIDMRVSRIEQRMDAAKENVAHVKADVSTEVSATLVETEEDDIVTTRTDDAKGVRDDAVDHVAFGIYQVIVWMREEWPMKVGAMFLLFASVWFAQIAIENEWVGPIGRIAVGIFAGGSVLAFGWFDMLRAQRRGSIFLVLGASAVIATLAVSRFVYPDVVPISSMGALISMFAIAAFVSFVSIQYKYRPLAILSVLTAGAVPMFTNGGSDVYALFAYLTAVACGTLFVSYRLDYRVLVALSVATTFLYSLPVSAAEGLAVLPIVFVLVTVYFVAHIHGLIKGRGRMGFADVAICTGTLAVLIYWVTRAAPEPWQGLIMAGWSLVFALGTYLLGRARGITNPFFLYGASATALLALGTFTEFSGGTRLAALTLELGVFIVAVRRIGAWRSSLAATLLFIPLFLAGILLINSRLWETGVMHAAAFAMLALGVVPLLLRVFVLRSGDNERHDEELPGLAYALLVMGGGVYSALYIWNVWHAIARISMWGSGFGTMLSHATYTAIGLWLYTRQGKTARFAGLIILGLVAARLFIIDIWSLDVPGRFITCLVVGVLFMSTAFYKKHFITHDHE